MDDVDAQIAKAVGRIAVEKVHGPKAGAPGRLHHRAMKLAVRVALEAPAEDSGAAAEAADADA